MENTNSLTPNWAQTIEKARILARIGRSKKDILYEYTDGLKHALKGGVFR